MFGDPASVVIEGDTWVDGGLDSKGCQILRNPRTGVTRVYR